ncbi:hypothetical protein G177_gp16 [Helicobacter phage KHP40]|uniref:Uncharacterized protein n=1 Tax=Helicobacter phage KHP40 TaxID=1204178 RepID=I7GUT5_9CAUD|nr:hypothetical protein G177_gp16 [Helicobacter phage KHP40]7DOU_4 Chain 4, Cement protein gp16 [Helicobacter phage KHP40]7DOU_5 Chain 5, Cement protein gp16 [Helicobacter phage KHP40]7DOU_6 Chain 6, Cement protein gp16 [Helicobacter phage KHP40]7F2P_1 Chain 1, Cement protein gp16 [Helicobacter phage KHP40]7F2P_2 Chain 2, Cement protein gp16 [Helicobacter phage KHP40]7F2P_3 Chain 3, Cement protein gp16 [Helicobacter phage KHP40]7F2P_4 Chain 4, Cement protein gp16 [Helicobacter phage KHP40]7
MKQKVHSVSYLAKAEFEYKNGVYDLVALPTGAEVIKISLEVVGLPTAGHVSVGFKDESKKNYSSILTLPVNETSGVVTKDYTVKSDKIVAAEVKDALAEGSDGRPVKCVLRALYFLPSVIEVEY